MSNQYSEYIITESEEEKLIKMYYENYSFNQMYIEMKIPIRKIRKFFKDKNMPLVKRYLVDEHIFDFIDNDEKAYWLGYLYCDGFVGEGKYNNIVLSSIDENIIDDFISFISISGNKFIKKENPIENRKNSFAKNVLYEARFSSKILKYKLNSYNIFVDRKEISFLNIEKIPLKYHKYVLFGMIDADGHVTQKGIKHVSLYITNKIKNSYIEFLISLSLSFSIKYNKHKDVYYARFLKKDIYTKEFFDEYHKYSKIDRKK